MRPPFTGGLSLSLLLHLLVVLGVFVWHQWLRMAPPPPPTVFEMVEPPGDPGPAVAAAAASSIPAREPAIRSVRQGPRIRSYTLPKPEVIPSDAVRVPVPATNTSEKPPRPAPSTSTTTYEDFVRQRQGTTPQTVRSPAVVAPRISTAIGEGLASQVRATGRGTSGRELDSEQAFAAELGALLRRNWQHPEGVNEELEALVEFELRADGGIRGARLVRSSGNGLFDRSVLAIFERVTQFRPTPSRESFRITQPFRLRELSAR